MIVTLQNDQLTVKIEDAGAQLSTITAADGTQYIWQGHPDIWVRRAPLLFPTLGRLKDGQYELDGKLYKMANHGFCRSAPFTVEQHSELSASFTYSETEETLACYPFAFTITVTYTLEGNRLHKAIRVDNPNDREMYFEIGGHDGFRIPLREGEVMDDYAIMIPGLTEIHPYGMNEEGMLTPKTVTYPLENGRIPVKPSVYGLDTIVLDELPQKRAMLVDKEGNVRVTLDFEDFTYLGLWTTLRDYDTNYVCIEPWTTLPDCTFVGRGLKDKAGICALAAGESKTVSYTTTFS